MKPRKMNVYKGLKVGDYVRWRDMDPYNDIGVSMVERQGLIVSFRSLDEFTRPFIYVDVLENKSGKIIPVLVHKIEKLDTN